MGVMLAAVFTGVAQTAQQDQFEIQPADDRPDIIYASVFTQETELGDAAEEQIAMDFLRGNTSSGSGGSTPTPRAKDRNGPAAGATVEANNTTKGNTGTTHTLHVESMNVRTGLYYVPIPESRWSVSQADTTAAVGRTRNTPADSITMDGVCDFEEF